MALIRTGGGVAQASGSVGGVVFSHNRSGPYMRSRAVPIQPRTSYQLSVRAAVSAASSLWLAQPLATREAWAAWAAVNKVPNRLGEMVTLQANAAFVAVNMRIAQLGETAVTTPPSVKMPIPLDMATVTADIGAGTTTIAFHRSPLAATESLHVRGALIPSLAERFVKNKLRFIVLASLASTTPFDYQSAFEARLGAMTVGMAVAIQSAVYDHATGLLSVPQYSFVAITSTP